MAIYKVIQDTKHVHHFQLDVGVTREQRCVAIAEPKLFWVSSSRNPFGIKRSRCAADDVAQL